MRRCLLALGAAVGLFLGLALLGPPATSGAWTHCDAVSPSTTEADCPTSTTAKPPESVPESHPTTTVPKATTTTAVTAPASTTTTVAKPTTTLKPPETAPAPTTSTLPGQNGHGGCIPGWHVPGAEGSGTPCLPDTPTTSRPPVTVEKQPVPVATTILATTTSAAAAAPTPAPAPTVTTAAPDTTTTEVTALAHTGWAGNLLVLGAVASVLAGGALLYSRRFGRAS